MDAKERQALIESILKKWQKILRLSEWKIKAVTSAHLHPKEKWGEVKIFDTIFRAEMHISTLCPEEDLQEVVIHELLHLLSTPLRQFFFKTLQELTRPQEGKIIADEVTSKDEKLLGNLALSFLERFTRGA
ncbi:unnamed protein product [marine sediment metagenome]|uniref:SprT-like domain-containing protein n=1 Tax=marine sediment metagenome TaxID=412755 RepID=X1ESS6_9ZZZZ